MRLIPATSARAARIAQAPPTDQLTPPTAHVSFFAVLPVDPADSISVLAQCGRMWCAVSMYGTDTLESGFEVSCSPHARVVGLSSNDVRGSLSNARSLVLLTAATEADAHELAAARRRLLMRAFWRTYRHLPAPAPAPGGRWLLHGWDRRRADTYAALGERVAGVIRDIRGGASPAATARELENVAGRASAAVGARLSAAVNRAFGEEAVVSAACGHFEAVDSTVNTVDGPVCGGCADEYYVSPVDSCQLHHMDSLFYWEADCAYHTEPEDEDEDEDEDGRDPDRRMDYSTNVMRFLRVDPSFESSPTGDFHMGVELETIFESDDRYDINCKVRDVREELGGDYLVAKYDGSLGDSGIEFVTRPTSLAVHRSKFSAWNESRGGLTAWDPGVCGMHVHIDSRAFTRASLGKLLQFFNKEDNVALIRKVAGRHPDRDAQAQGYAARDVPADATHSPIAALKGKRLSRYTMVNLENLDCFEAVRLGATYVGGSANTVEVRIYRASMSRGRQLAQLEFTHALVMFCRAAGYRNLGEIDFTRWLAGRTGGYPSLAAFLGVRPNKHGPEDPNCAKHATEPETEVETAA